VTLTVLTIKSRLLKKKIVLPSINFAVISIMTNRLCKIQNIFYLMNFPCISQQEHKCNDTISLSTHPADPRVNEDHALITTDLLI